MKGFLQLVIVLFICFSGYQTYRLYQEKDVIQSDLNQVLNEYSAQTLFSEKGVRERVASIMETHGVTLNNETFPLKLDETTRVAEFSVDFKKSPELFVVSIPLSFHIDVPKRSKEGEGLVGGARKTIGGADETQGKKVEQLDEIAK